MAEIIKKLANLIGPIAVNKGRRQEERIVEITV